MSESTEINPPTRAFDEVVTLVVKHRVKAGFEVPYNAWLRKIVRIAGQWDGHLGVDVVPGKSAGLDTYTCVLRFCSTDAMQRWLDSSQRRELVNEATPMLADGDQTEVNPVNEFWFAPHTESRTPPPPLEAGRADADGDFSPYLAGAADLEALAGLEPFFLPVRGRHLCDHADHRCFGGLSVYANGDACVRALADCCH